MFKVTACYLLNKLIKSFYLLHLENLYAFVEIVGLKPLGNLVEGVGGVFLDHELVVSDFEHSQSVLLIEVDAAFSFSRVTNASPSTCIAVAVFEKVFAFLCKFYLSVPI